MPVGIFWERKSAASRLALAWLIPVLCFRTSEALAVTTVTHEFESDPHFFQFAVDALEQGFGLVADNGG